MSKQAELISPAQVVAEFPDWRCNEKTTRELIRRGELPGERWGGRYFTTRAAVEQYIIEAANRARGAMPVVLPTPVASVDLRAKRRSRAGNARG